MMKKNKGRVYSIVGFICAIISLLFLPIVFGSAAIILGVVARKKGDSSFGLVVIVLGVVLMVSGMVLGAVVNVLMNWNEISGNAVKAVV